MFSRRLVERHCDRVTALRWQGSGVCCIEIVRLQHRAVVRATVRANVLADVRGHFIGGVGPAGRTHCLAVPPADIDEIAIFTVYFNMAAA